MTRTALKLQQTVPPTVPPKRSRAKQPSHRGVRIVVRLRADGSKSYRARWESPDTGKTEHEPLPGDDQPNATERRRQRCVELKKEKLDDRRKALDAGAERIDSIGGELKPAFEEFFATCQRLRPDSIANYRRGYEWFERWAKKASVHSCRQIQKTKLRAYRTWIVSRKLENGKPMAASTVNSYLSWLRVSLIELSKMGRIPVKPEEIKEALEPEDDDSVQREFYRPKQLQAIIKACIEHDEDIYNGTLVGRLLPIVLFILLTGVRAKEARMLEWSHVGTDPMGNPAIYVPPHIAKTGRRRSRGRYIYLKHSPLLAHLVAGSAKRTGQLLAGVTENILEKALARVYETTGVDFCCQALRCSTGTYLTCAPDIFGSASQHMSADQLGHSVEIARQHYVGQILIERGICTTEDAMQLGIKIGECPQL